MAHLQSKSEERNYLQLYVKSTSNCKGLPLQNFELLSPTWSGPNVEIPFVDPGGDDEIGDSDDEAIVVCEVTGWTDLFGGRPCWVRVAWARWLAQPTEAAEKLTGRPDWMRSVGILLWGGNSGLRVTGPGVYEDGFGLPIMWLEDVSLLPDDVQATISKLEVEV